jgi:hypothetical protein
VPSSRDEEPGGFETAGERQARPPRRGGVLLGARWELPLIGLLIVGGAAGLAYVLFRNLTDPAFDGTIWTWGTAGVLCAGLVVLLFASPSIRHEVSRLWHRSEKRAYPA